MELGPQSLAECPEPRQRVSSFPAVPDDALCQPGGQAAQQQLVGTQDTRAVAAEGLRGCPPLHSELRAPWVLPAQELLPRAMFGLPSAARAAWGSETVSFCAAGSFYRQALSAWTCILFFFSSFMGKGSAAYQ